MVERSTSHYCVTITKHTEKESRYQSTSLFGEGGGRVAVEYYTKTLFAITSLLYIARVMSKKNPKPTQSFPKPLKKLRQLGV